MDDDRMREKKTVGSSSHARNTKKGKVEGPMPPVLSAIEKKNVIPRRGTAHSRYWFVFRHVN
jgi:ribosomal protein S30